MGSYHDEVTDFLENDRFRKWVYEATSEDDIFWKEFLILHPEKAEIILSAKTILLEVQSDSEKEFPSEEKVGTMLSAIHFAKNNKDHHISGLRFNRRVITLAAAAMVILITGWLLSSGKSGSTVTYDDLVSSISTPLIEKVNSTSKRVTITLPDSSIVILYPHTSISYNADFEKDGKREVYLSGEAFFNVRKNPERPFFVYANELITKVLGTSFTVKAFDCLKEVEVVVKTGKVSVFTRTDEFDKLSRSNSELGGVIITPNQKVLFSREEIKIKKSLVESPEIIASAVLPPPMLKFQDASVPDIFDNLEQTYGIDIVYDEDLFRNCLLTASFSNENLYDKIDLICKGIEADFEVVDARVVIAGRGCH